MKCLNCNSVFLEGTWEHYITVWREAEKYAILFLFELNAEFEATLIIIISTSPDIEPTPLYIIMLELPPHCAIIIGEIL